MSKRNAIRVTHNPHSAESVAYTVQRYGAIKPETLAEIVAWLETPEAKAERVYTVYQETIGNIEAGIEVFTFPVIKTNRIGSAIEKFIDNEHDAQNTLANIRNKDFPNNKQGT
jgi:hypothetical protein